MTRLRPWQQEALEKALRWLVEERADRHFLINVRISAHRGRHFSLMVDGISA